MLLAFLLALVGIVRMDDPLRPQYHVMPEKNWLNDPNGPVYYNGYYHMFFQHNPNAAVWGDMHWVSAIKPLRFCSSRIYFQSRLTATAKIWFIGLIYPLLWHQINRMISTVSSLEVLLLSTVFPSLYIRVLQTARRKCNVKHDRLTYPIPP